MRRGIFGRKPLGKGEATHNAGGVVETHSLTVQTPPCEAAGSSKLGFRSRNRHWFYLTSLPPFVPRYEYPLIVQWRSLWERATSHPWGLWKRLPRAVMTQSSELSNLKDNFETLFALIVGHRKRRHRYARLISPRWWFSLATALAGDTPACFLGRLDHRSADRLSSRGNYTMLSSTSILAAHSDPLLKGGTSFLRLPWGRITTAPDALDLEAEPPHVGG